MWSEKERPKPSQDETQKRRYVKQGGKFGRFKAVTVDLSQETSRSEDLAQVISGTRSSKFFHLFHLNSFISS